MCKRFLLCFHDLSVWNFRTVVPVLETLKDLCGRAFSVLVIPCTDGADERTVSEFREALHLLVADGFELSLHGYKHKAEFSQGRSYFGLMSMNLTGGEAEFAGLSEFESGRLLREAESAWKQLFAGGERPAAFIPPTWYSNRFLPHQVRSMGMLYENRFMVMKANGKRYFSPVTSFAGIPDALMNTAFGFGKFILDLPVGLPRIALHPVDFPDRKAKVYDLVRAALGSDRKLALYSEL